MPIVVTGAGAGSGLEPTAEPRLEIRKLMEDKMQWSLYVQAVAALQQRVEYVDVNNKKLGVNTSSSFGLSKIHGNPVESLWDGVAQSSIFCAHGTTLFPTWHRPYLALYEQTLQSAALDIANKYNERDRPSWVLAASNLRAPYWDWAMVHKRDGKLPPKEVYDQGLHPTLRITKPDGETDFPNPLLAYHFHESFSHGYPNKAKTVRYPFIATGDSDPRAFEARINGEKDIRQATLRTLLDLKEWLDFATIRINPKDRPSGANSLESLHGAMHNNIGGLGDRTHGSGYMSDVPIAAFDPIFWMHHSNVDRLLSLWQELHPGVWVAPDEKSNPQQNNVDSQLEPFYHSEQSFFTSAVSSVVHPDQLYYTYPELQGLSTDPQQRQKEVQDRVRALYGPSTRVMKPGQSAGAERSSHKTEWIARARFGHFSLSQSFDVLLFLGNPPDDASDWYSASNLAGTISIFANSRADQCRNCQKNIDAIGEAFTVLDDGLRAQPVPQLRLEDDGSVEEYLKNNLQVRVWKMDGSNERPENVPKLVVDFLAAPMEWSPEEARYKPTGAPLTVCASVVGTGY